MKMSNVIVAVSMWCLMMSAIKAARPPRPTPATSPPPPARGYHTVTWLLNHDPDTYSAFLTTLRGELGHGTLCNIPVTSQTASGDREFVYVELETLNGQNNIILLIRASDSYIVGFQDKFNGVSRANFINDEFANLKGSRVFPDALESQRKSLPFTSDYKDIENYSKISRDKLPVGVSELEKAMEKIYGIDYGHQYGKDSAIFSLIAIQMVAEAARFKHIENKVISSGIYEYAAFKPGRLVELEINWSAISRSIVEPACTPRQVKDFTMEEMELSLILFPKVNLNLNDDGVINNASLSLM